MAKKAFMKNLEKSKKEDPKKDMKAGKKGFKPFEKKKKK
jgi:hypothetical protein